jgi:predicted hydrocarbon binding protein
MDLVIVCVEAKAMINELDEKEKLLERAGGVLSSIIRSLDKVGLETRKKIMELCGEACARSDGDLEIAERIAEETADENEIVARVNREIAWCGTWTRKDNTIQCTCVKCGCPLVRKKVVDLSGTFCYCSRGWVKKIFETSLKKSVNVELEKSIGRGDKVCKFVVYT